MIPGEYFVVANGVMYSCAAVLDGLAGKWTWAIVWGSYAISCFALEWMESGR